MDRARGREQLHCSWSDTDVFGEVFPSYGSGAIDEEFGGAGDVCSIGTSAGVQKLVTPNHFSFGIREEWECVAALAAEFLGDLLRVNADGDGKDSLCCEFR